MAATSAATAAIRVSTSVVEAGDAWLAGGAAMVGASVVDGVAASGVAGISEGVPASVAAVTSKTLGFCSTMFVEVGGGA